MRRIDRIGLFFQSKSWVVLVIGVAFIIYKMPDAIDQMGRESQYKNLVNLCENAGYDYYRRINKFPDGDEENEIRLECAAAAASCAWGNDTLAYYKAPLWSYDCDGRNDDTTRN